ncbi:Proteophosphoglycan ppg4 [Rhodotorula toruloides]|nr:Proteophosphoglycan ppg4 [Rhodotorula toruloides]
MPLRTRTAAHLDKAPMSSRALPTELLLRIFSFIDEGPISERRAAYRALALASKHFYSLAQPRLHRAICADIVFAVRRRDPVLESAFCALDKSPELAACVEILELTVKAGDLGGRTGGMAKSRIPAMPNLRKVVLKPEVPRKWSCQTPLTLVFVALGSASPRIESLDLSDFPVGPDKSSTPFPVWHRRWWQTDDIANDLFDFFWCGQHLRDTFPTLRELKLAKKGWRSSSDRHLLVQDLKGQGVKVILV